MTTPRELSIAFQTDKSPADYVALARLVNKYAFDAVSVYCDAPFHPSYSPLLLMAPHIERARLGPAGVSPARMPPIDMAANTALLDAVAPGGAYLGIVRGGWLAAHGIAEPARPLAAIREAVDIVRLLLTGQSGGYQGAVYRLAEHVQAPYPLPEHLPPIMIGTWGEKLAAIAGEIGNEVKVGGGANPDIVPIMQAFIAAGEQRAGRAGRSVGVVLGAVSVVDEDRQAARHLARREVALYLPIVAALDPTAAIEPELIARIETHVNRHEQEAAATLISDDLLDRFAFAGSPADLVAHCEACFAAGARRIEFGTPHGLSSQSGIRLLGEKVLPALQSYP
jgi:5,10-methylenetetrahydromethanopterin reductase